MELIFVNFHKGEEKVVGVEMTFNWQIAKLPKDLNFRKVYFAGELDKHAEVSLDEVRAIYKAQFNFDDLKDKRLVAFQNLKKLEYYMSQPDLYDRIEIVLYQWSSGY